MIIIYHTVSVPLSRHPRIPAFFFGIFAGIRAHPYLCSANWVSLIPPPFPKHKCENNETPTVMRSHLSESDRFRDGCHTFTQKIMQLSYVVIFLYDRNFLILLIFLAIFISDFCRSFPQVYRLVS